MIDLNQVDAQPVGMTQRKENFALEYIKTGNASEAYRRAYPASRKWKDKTVWARASELLADGKVSGRVEDLKAKAESVAVATRQEVLEILTRILRACPADVIDEGGYIDLDKLRACRQEIAEVTVEDTITGRKYKAKFRSVEQAADRIAKLQGWDAPQKIEHSGELRQVVEVVRHDDGRDAS